jgi:hypothetical protein
VQEYDKMRQRFGDHMRDGVGGENIIVQGIDSLPSLTPTQRYFIRQQADGNLIELVNVIPAAPCREFSVFCVQQTISGAALKDTLLFLDDGTRGYYAELVKTDCQCFVQAGDELLLG